MSCVVLNCKSTWGPETNIKFHRFPKDEERRNLWLSIIRIKNHFYPSAKICSLHFKPDKYNPRRPGCLLSTATPFYLPNTEDCALTVTKNQLSGKMSNVDVETDSGNEMSSLEHFQDKDVCRLYSNTDVKTDSVNEMPSYEYFQDKDVCRLCWSKEGEQDSSSVSPNEKKQAENELFAKIKYCLDLEFKCDSFPNKVCKRCCLKVEEFYEFKVKCQKSENKLQEILKKVQENTKHTEIIYDVKIEREDDCEITDKNTCDSFDCPEEFIDSNCSSNNQNGVKLTDFEVEIDGSKCLFEYDLDNTYTYKEHDYHTSKADEYFKKLETEKRKNKKEKNALKRGINITCREKRFDGLKPIRVNKKKYERKRSPTYCNTCRSDFASKEMFDSHNASSHGIEAENQYKCFGCEKRLKTRRKRFNHERYFCKGLKDGYKCSICDRLLPRRSMYDAHMRDHAKNPNIKLSEDIFECRKCEKLFKTKLNLKEHLDKQHPLKINNYVCETCGRVFTRTDYLFKHRLTHTGTKKYVCPHCGYKCTQKSSLNVHMRKHTGERPYSCDLCPQQCTSSSNLRKHRRSHLGNKTFECTICSKKFGYKISLEEHIASVHERSQAFPCELCGALYTRSRGLRRHIHAKHGKQKVDKPPPRDGSTCEEVSFLPKDVASKCDENIYLKILDNDNKKKVISENTVYEIKEGDEFVLLNADSGVILTKMY